MMIRLPILDECPSSDHVANCGQGDVDVLDVLEGDTVANPTQLICLRYMPRSETQGPLRKGIQEW
jgi:hypothetical protein